MRLGIAVVFCLTFGLVGCAGALIGGVGGGFAGHALAGGASTGLRVLATGAGIGAGVYAGNEVEKKLK